ncbi:MAG: PIG-L domain-containing protein [Acidimicrobiaceae bacterium]|nr:PIG-L domain-containing protein [Acidimicrobiaceae bacterium]
MHTQNIPTPRTALAVGAHPDDIEFGAGATLAKWAADGCVVSFLVCTDGSKGTWDPSADIKNLIASRKLEQLEAAKKIPVEGKVVFLGCTDGELRDDGTLRKRITRVIRELKPEVILGHDPWKRYRLHPDHRVAGFLTIDALVAARDPFFYPEQELEPHRPGELFLYEAEDADHFEECRGFEAAKIESLLCHISQFESTMGIDITEKESTTEEFRDRVMSQLASREKETGFLAAEAFKRITNL